METLTKTQTEQGGIINNLDPIADMIGAMTMEEYINFIVHNVIPKRFL